FVIIENDGQRAAEFSQRGFNVLLGDATLEENFEVGRRRASAGPGGLSAKRRRQRLCRADFARSKSPTSYRRAGSRGTGRSQAGARGRESRRRANDHRGPPNGNFTNEAGGWRIL